MRSWVLATRPETKGRAAIPGLPSHHALEALTMSRLTLASGSIPSSFMICFIWALLQPRSRTQAELSSKHPSTSLAAGLSTSPPPPQVRRIYIHGRASVLTLDCTPAKSRSFCTRSSTCVFKFAFSWTSRIPTSFKRPSMSCSSSTACGTGEHAHVKCHSTRTGQATCLQLRAAGHRHPSDLKASAWRSKHGALAKSASFSGSLRS